MLPRPSLIGGGGTPQRGGDPVPAREHGDEHGVGGGDERGVGGGAGVCGHA